MKNLVALILISLFAAAGALSVPSHAEDAKTKAKAKSKTEATRSKDAEPKKATGTRKKTHSFDDDVIEGLNTNPLDSLEHIAKKDGRDQLRLYRKRLHYHEEIKNSVKDLGYTP